MPQAVSKDKRDKAGEMTQQMGIWIAPLNYLTLIPSMFFCIFSSRII